MNIGFIGFGNTAYHIASGLYRERVRGICAHDSLQEDAVTGRVIRSRAKEAHVTLKDSSSDLAQWADVIIATVPSIHILEVCQEIKGCLRKGKLFVDLSPSTADFKEVVWKTIKATNVYFVNAALTGSKMTWKHPISMTASGNGAQLFKDIMTPYHMDITLAGKKPGAASAIYEDQESAQWDQVPAIALSAD